MEACDCLTSDCHFLSPCALPLSECGVGGIMLKAEYEFVQDNTVNVFSFMSSESSDSKIYVTSVLLYTFFLELHSEIFPRDYMITDSLKIIIYEERKTQGKPKAPFLGSSSLIRR